MNAFMALPNVLVVVILSGVIAKETKHYVWDNNLDEPSPDKLITVDH